MGVPVTKHGAARGGRGERRARRLERDREDVRQSGHGADRAAGHHVAVPEHDRDAQRRGGHQDRDGHVPAGREDDVRSRAGEHRGGLRHGRGEAQRVEDGVDVTLRRPQGADGQSAQRDTGRGHDGALQPAMAADPAKVRRVRPGAE